MNYALHGNLGVVEDWENCWPAGENFYALDLWNEVGQGVGLKEWGRRFCRRVHDQNQDQTPTGSHWLVGYSLGGRLALHALSAAPEVWGGAVIISAHPGLTSDEERTERLNRDREWARKTRQGKWRTFLQQWNAQTVFGGAAKKDAAARQGSLESRRESVALAFENWSLGLQEDLRGQLAKCQIPVLWVTGADDKKFSAIGAEMASVMSGGEHHQIVGCGHRVLHEAPQRLAALIGDFQKRNL